MIICESEPPFADLYTQNLVLGFEALNHILLVLVGYARQYEAEELPRVMRL